MKSLEYNSLMIKEITFGTSRIIRDIDNPATNSSPRSFGLPLVFAMDKAEIAICRMSE
jgi:hypothetical protein